MYRFSQHLLVVAVACAGFTGCVTPGLNDVDFIERKLARPDAIEVFDYRADGRTIRFVETGERGKPLVVFVHGSPGNWKAFSAYLQDPAMVSRFHLIAVDRPGFGGSGDGRAERSITAQAALIAPVLERNESPHGAILVGHSFGGPIIARLAMDYPHRVGGLIFLAPALDPELEKMYWYQFLAKFTPVAVFTPRNLRTANAEILPLKPQLVEILDRWDEIRIPVTHIHGEKDMLVPVEHTDFVERVLGHTDLRVVRLEGENHFIPWTRADLVRAAIFRHAIKLGAEGDYPGALADE